MMRQRFVPVLAAIAALAATAVRAPAAVSESRRTPLVRAIEAARPSVVNLHSRKNSPSGAGEASMSGMGTGVIVDERGYVVTNYHVIENVASIRATLVDGTTSEARVLARDPRTDLALLKIDVDGTLPVMPMGTSDDLMYGETVVAIGNAFGYEHTVTRGIVSELHRDVRLSAEQSYYDLIQTDASINPGNSGGPLINVDGEMIGLNVAIRAGAQGIGFAIPVDDVRCVLAELMSVRNLKGTWHGLVADHVKDARGEKSVVVRDVEPGSPAENAGVRRGDRIVSVDGKPVRCSFDIERALLDKSGDQNVPLIVARESDRLEFAMTLRSKLGPAATNKDRIWRELGLRFRSDADADALVSRSFPQLRGGLRISSIRSGSVAEAAGFRPGDVLVGLDQWETLSPENVIYVLNRYRESTVDRIRFYVVRDGRTHRGWLPLP